MGYPNQQQGDKIPRESRIMSVLDSLEGMMCLRGEERVAESEALVALEDCSGRQFDPDLIERIVPLIKSKPPKFLRSVDG